ncbi:MAG: DUF2255 family protein [Gemmatimonadaceae bacterium]
MTEKRTFPTAVIAMLDESKILGIRAGDGDHKFLGIWVVVVNGRVFVRPWNDKPSGWREVFRHDPLGAIQIGNREIRIRAKAVRAERLNDRVDEAYGLKYPTPASRKWVTGFATPQRRATTVELRPR